MTVTATLKTLGLGLLGTVALASILFGLLVVFGWFVASRL
jgi:hypothetical protein